MKEITIVNEELKSVLNDIIWFYDNRSDLDNTRPDCSTKDKDRDYYLGETYRKHILSMGSAHNGYPEVLLGYNLRSMNDSSDGRGLPLEWCERWRQIQERLMQILAVRNTAVATIYPPGGYISWHNNANAAGFNLLFTWSETGAGSFDYIEEDGSITSLEDRKGEWVCRYGMFGQYEQSEHPLVYHMATTDCWRFTLGFVFSTKESAGQLQDFIIEEITTP